MPKTRLQLRTAVRSNLLEPTPARWTDDDLNRYLDDGQDDLAKVSQTTRLETVAVLANASTVTTPSTILNLRWPAYWEDSAGTRSKVRLSNRAMPIDSTTTGRPRWAWKNGKTITLWPKPSDNGNLLIRGVEKPAAFADDNAVSTLEDVDEALIAYATWKAYGVDFDPQRKDWQQDYLSRKVDYAAMEVSKNPQGAQIDDAYGELDDMPDTPWDHIY